MNILRHSRCAVYAVLLSVGPGCVEAYEVYRISANVRTSITFPVVADSDIPVRAFLKATGGRWQACELQRENGRASVSVDPRANGGPDFLLLLNPPPGMAIDDQTPPVCVGLFVDGKPQPVAGDVDLGRMQGSPSVLRWCLADAENAIDTASVRVEVDDSALAASSLSFEPLAEGRVAVAVSVPQLDYGTHKVRLTVCDTAPDTNRFSHTAAFELFDATNCVRAEPGVAQVLVDSHFPNYPSLDPLTDGVRELPGSSAGNDVTWASAESAEPHWIEIRLKGECQLREVTVYWARDSVISRRFEVQLPGDEGWSTVASTGSARARPARCQTLRFPATKADRFRGFQPPNCGPESRSGLMWVLEVEAR